ncbi:MAG: glycosyltransferase family 39 protein [Candidatus Poribacteria bacterium]|nr:glycosyltransferase family 39 protein [Candidatus Poribacteria bacterium]
MNLTLFRRIQTYLTREKAICFIPVIAVWLSLALSPYCTTFWDSGIYVNMGNSIANGHGCKYLGYTFKYPPIFPFMLAAIIVPFGYNFLLMRMLMVAFATASMWLAYLIVRDRSNRWIATGVMLSAAFSYPILFESTRILSDLPYMLFSLLAIRWIERYAQQSEPWRSKTGYIAIGLIVVSYFTRIVGVTLLAGTIAYLGLGGTNLPRSRANLKKAIAVSVVLITVVSIWMARSALNQNRFPPELRQGLSYGKELFVTTTEDPDASTIDWTHLFERIRENEKYYEILFANIILGKQRRIRARTEIRPDAGARAIALILLVGYLVCAFRNRSVLEYYTFFYLLIYILWPSRQRERFLVPIIPFLFYYFFHFLQWVMSGIRWLVQRFSQWEDQRKLIDVVAVLVFTGVFIQGNWQTNMRLIRYEQREPYYTGRYGILRDFVQWLTDNTPDDTVIVSSEPSFIQVSFEEFAPKNATHRKVFGFPWTTDQTKLLEFMDRLEVDYVITVPSGKAKEYLHPLIEQSSARFEKVHRYGKYVIYRVRPPKPTG